MIGSIQKDVWQHVLSYMATIDCIRLLRVCKALKDTVYREFTARAQVLHPYTFSTSPIKPQSFIALFRVVLTQPRKIFLYWDPLVAAYVLNCTNKESSLNFGFGKHPRFKRTSSMCWIDDVGKDIASIIMWNANSKLHVEAYGCQLLLDAQRRWVDSFSQDVKTIFQWKRRGQ